MFVEIFSIKLNQINNDGIIDLNFLNKDTTEVFIEVIIPSANDIITTENKRGTRCRSSSMSRGRICHVFLLLLKCFVN